MNSNEAVKQDAIKQLENHKYTLLIKNEKIEAWRCSKPSTNVYAFDIIITTLGIAVVGDIDNMTFRVGSSYGISFLAGDDVGYYIHSKLEQNCRETEFDKVALQYAVLDKIAETIEDNPDLMFHKVTAPECISDGSYMPGTDKGADFELALSFVNAASDVASTSSFWDDLDDFLSDVENTEDTDEAYRLLNECEVLRFSDAGDYRLSRTSESLLSRLYMVNHAAKQIFAQIASSEPSE